MYFGICYIWCLEETITTLTQQKVDKKRKSEGEMEGKKEGREEKVEKKRKTWGR